MEKYKSNRIEIEQMVDRYQRMFRAHPQSTYLTSVVNWIMNHLTTREAELVLKRAVETLDHFPSIHQTKEIADWLQANKPKTNNKTRIIEKDCPDCCGDGLVFMRNELNAKYIFSCMTCENGRIQREASHCAPPTSTGYDKGMLKEIRM